MRVGTYRIRQRDDLFWPERLSWFPCPPFKEWFNHDGLQLPIFYPTFPTQAEAETWLDERLNPEKYTKTVRVYERS